MEKTRVIIMGAAGRDFHNFNVFFRDNPAYEVVAFTATQIPGIEDKTYPRVLSGELYPNGIPIHHPMPYGDLTRQVVERFATYRDLDTYECTIEEREEYEPHIDLGAVIYAGVDYGKIVKEAEKEADVIVWDGGNNDFPFYYSNL